MRPHSSVLTKFPIDKRPAHQFDVVERLIEHGRVAASPIQPEQRRSAEL